MLDLSQFESIGDNCEFAFVQASHGVHDGALLRWARTKEIEDLIEAIETDFEGAFLFENLAPMHDDMVVDLKTRIIFHGSLRSSLVNGVRRWDEPDEDKRRSIYADDSVKRAYLLSKFRRHAATGEKIFVYKSNAIAPPFQHDRLLAALRRYGMARLLVVEWTESHSLAGKVISSSEGFAKAYTPRFAPYGTANDYAHGIWEIICRQAVQILSPRLMQAAE